MTKHEISRRQMIGAGMGLAAGMAGSSVLQAAAPERTHSLNEIYARARGGAGDAPGLWWYTGRLWGKLNNDRAANFFAVEGFSFNRMVRGANGELRQVMEECGFWKDPDSKALLDDWVNPLNGLPCKTRHFRSRQDLTFSADGRTSNSGRFEGHVAEPIVSGPILWISEILLGVFPSPREPDQDPLTYSGATRTATSLVTYTMDAKEALAEDPGFVASTMNYQSMSNWYPWMRMGQAPGQMMFELSGRKLRSMDEIPPDFRATLDDRRAGFLEDPNID
jgi:hypothetical protein